MLNIKNIAVIGDSVAWGQGLLDSHKYASIVAASFGLPLVVPPSNAAHSGAIIGLHGKSQHAGVDPEVPEPAPTILAQVDRVPSPGTVDLLLLGGGINDVDVRFILNPLAKSSELLDRTRDACYSGMKALLQKSAGVFTHPACHFVVSGYYPILSTDSDPALHPHPDAFKRFLRLFGLSTLDHLDHKLVFGGICARAMQFWRDSDRFLLQAVTEAAASSGVGNRLHFAPSTFNEKNALFATDPLLFGLSKTLQAEDEVVAARIISCDKQYTNPFDLLQRESCHRASVGHPNVKGARAISKSIINSLPS